MRSTFYGLEIARTALHVQQKQLDITNHNIANVNTEGYSRQRGTTKAIPSYYGDVGRGVAMQEIKQIRDSFLDMQLRNEVKSLGEWETKADFLSNIEAIYNEPSDSGIRTVVDQFYNSLQELGKNPESREIRALVHQRAVALTETINHMTRQLGELREEVNSAIDIRVQEINSYVKQISDLNQQIFKQEISGGRANDLRDQRELLVDKLSKLINIRSYETSQGHLRIDVGTTALVDHYNTNEMVTETDADGFLNIVWKGSGKEVDLQSGTLKGLLDIRDGTGKDGQYSGIPYYMQEMCYFSGQFAYKFNEIHRQGYGLDGSTDHDFFTFDTMVGSQGGFADRTDFLAKLENGQVDIYNWDIGISSDIDNFDHIAASLNGEEGDNENLLKLIETRHDKIFDGTSTIDDFTKSLIAVLGVDAQQAIRMQENQTVLVRQMDNRRLATSGVSLDEEMANLIKFQHSYNAAARVITSVDEMLDTIVSRMGIVGR